MKTSKNTNKRTKADPVKIERHVRLTNARKAFRYLNWSMTVLSEMQMMKSYDDVWNASSELNAKFGGRLST